MSVGYAAMFAVVFIYLFIHVSMIFVLGVAYGLRTNFDGAISWIIGIAVGFISFLVYSSIWSVLVLILAPMISYYFLVTSTEEPREFQVYQGETYTWFLYILSIITGLISFLFLAYGFLLMIQGDPLAIPPILISPIIPLSAGLYVLYLLEKEENGLHLANKLIKRIYTQKLMNK